MAELMIFKEKHCDRYFAVKDDDDRNKVALKILKERSESGYYYPEKENIEADRESRINQIKEVYKDYWELTEEEINNLPDGLKNKAQEEKEKFNKSLKRIELNFSIDLQWTKNLENLINATEEEALNMVFTTPRGNKRKLAFQLIYERSLNGYEDFEEEPLEDY